MLVKYRLIKNLLFTIALVVVILFISTVSFKASVDARPPDAEFYNGIAGEPRCLVSDLAGAAVMPCTDNVNIPQDQIDYSGAGCYNVDVTVQGTTVTKLNDCLGSEFTGVVASDDKAAIAAETEAAKELKNASREDALKCIENKTALGKTQEQAEEECFKENPIVELIRWAIIFLTGAVGIVITVIIILAGIEYSASGGDPNKAAQAKKRIYNALIALIAYIFLWTFMQWLVPGGIS